MPRQFFPMITISCKWWFSSMVFIAFGTVSFFAFDSGTTLAQTTRVWSDDSGSFSVEAELIKIKASSVMLKKLNGVEIEVPFTRLSQADNRYVDKLQKKPSPPAAVVIPKPSKQSDPEPTATKANPPEIELPPASKKSNAAQTKPHVETPTPPKPSKDLPDALSKPRDTTPPTSDVNQVDLFNSLAGAGPHPRSNPQPKNLRDVSPQEIEAIPQPFQKFAWMISDITKRKSTRAGLVALGSNWPKQKMPTLVKLVRLSTKSSDSKIRKLAIDLLAERDASESLQLIISGTDDENFFVRWACYEWLEKLGDARAIDPLTKKLTTDDRDQAAATLISFGNAAESKVLPLLSVKSEQIQLTVCSLLGKIGSLKSIPSLELVVANSKNIKVRMQAKNAIKKIKQRRSNNDNPPMIGND